MATAPRGEGRLDGIGDALVFLGFVILGCVYIIWAKLIDLPAAAVTMVPVSIMLIYAAAILFVRAMRIADDQGGDNLYYMGFLFTLTSLGVSLWQFDASGNTETIVRNFGIAIASTIAGIALRIFLNQMRRDPATMERGVRADLTDAARRVRRELDATVVELNHFRRSSEQAALESWTGVRTQVEATADLLMAELRGAGTSALGPIAAAAETTRVAIEKMAGELASGGEAMAGRVRAVEVGTSDLITALDQLTSRLKALETPEHLVSLKVEPVIAPLAEAVERFSAALGAHQAALGELSRGLGDLKANRVEDRQQIEALSAEIVGLRKAVEARR